MVGVVALATRAATKQVLISEVNALLKFLAGRTRVAGCRPPWGTAVGRPNQVRKAVLQPS
jgi:hypothetical protein